jgi:SAM-dependent methyltransferase
MLDALEPLADAHVLDFACGPGVTSAWLAARGALVTGIDLSPRSVARAEELARRVGARASFLAGDLSDVELPLFDRIAGRYALHHVDVRSVAPLLARHLRRGGRAAFLETASSNPLFRIARRGLVGRFRVPRYGTEDERPLARHDLAVLEEHFGPLRVEVAEMQFLRILDRQLLGYRHPRASRMLAWVDDRLLRLGWRSGSYQQVLVLDRR